ncbi:class F sortase [Actinokineospora sp. G85]|uniref:class F sortase n=1 Tax=Actinokineospora sp. G85 TaxID=3406626 RepID=UPI003C7531F6
MRSAATARAALVATLVVTSCSAGPQAPPAPPPPTAPGELSPPAPVGLEIPAIGVNETQLVPLALGASGELMAPTDYARVGWYAAGTVPGEVGPAVLAGHVDSWTGPAVFFRLRELAPGDRVTVRRDDDTTAEFTVDEVRRYPKAAFPTDAVYAPVPGAALRLITCGGSFDAGRRSYRDNVVVFASAGWAVT